MCSSVPMFPGYNVTQQLCSPVPIFPYNFIALYLCSPVIILHSTYDPQKICSLVIMLPGTCSLVFVIPNVFHSTNVPSSLCSSESKFPVVNISQYLFPGTYVLPGLTVKVMKMLDFHFKYIKKIKKDRNLQCRHCTDKHSYYPFFSCSFFSYDFYKTLRFFTAYIKPDENKYIQPILKSNKKIKINKMK